MKQSAGFTNFISTSLSLFFISAKYTGSHFPNFTYALLPSSVHARTQWEWAYSSMFLFVLRKRWESLRTSFLFRSLSLHERSEWQAYCSPKFFCAFTHFVLSIDFQSESDSPNSSSHSFSEKIGKVYGGYMTEESRDKLLFFAVVKIKFC